MFIDDEPWADGEPGTASLLRAHKVTQDLEKMLAGDDWQDNDLVFCQADGRPWLPDHVSKKLKRLAVRGWLEEEPGGLFRLPDHAGETAKAGR